MPVPKGGYAAKQATCRSSAREQPLPFLRNIGAIGGSADARNKLRQKRTRRAIAFVFVAICIAWYASLVLSTASSEAVFRANNINYQAADRASLATLYTAAYGGVDISELLLKKKLFRVQPGTGCRILERDSSIKCTSGADYSIRVRLTDGPRAGQSVWACSAEVSLKMAYP